MLDVLRKAFSMERYSSLDTPAMTFINPGPAYMLINALAVTGITYFIAFKVLNVRTLLLWSGHALLHSSVYPTLTKIFAH